MLPCMHKFHMSCIDPWLTNSPFCPMCKLSVLFYHFYKNDFYFFLLLYWLTIISCPMCECAFIFPLIFFLAYNQPTIPRTHTQTHRSAPGRPTHTHIHAHTQVRTGQFQMDTPTRRAVTRVQSAAAPRRSQPAPSAGDRYAAAARSTTRCPCLCLRPPHGVCLCLRLWVRVSMVSSLSLTCSGCG